MPPFDSARRLRSATHLPSASPATRWSSEHPTARSAVPRGPSIIIGSTPAAPPLVACPTRARTPGLCQGWSLSAASRRARDAFVAPPPRRLLPKPPDDDGRRGCARAVPGARIVAFRGEVGAARQPPEGGRAAQRGLHWQPKIALHLS